MELTQVYSIETDDGLLRLTMLMEHGKRKFKKELTLEFGEGKYTASWDNFWFIKKLYQDLKARKKKSKRLKSLSRDLAVCSMVMSRVEVRKFLKAAFKIIKSVEKGYE